MLEIEQQVSGNHILRVYLWLLLVLHATLDKEFGVGSSVLKFPNSCSNSLEFAAHGATLSVYLMFCLHK